MQGDISHENAENSGENLNVKSHKSEDTDGLQMQMPSSILVNDETNMLRESQSYGRGEGQNMRANGDNETFEISMPESPQQKKLLDRSAYERSSIINENEVQKIIVKENNVASHQ